MSFMFFLFFWHFLQKRTYRSFFFWGLLKLRREICGRLWGLWDFEVAQSFGMGRCKSEFFFGDPLVNSWETRKIWDQLTFDHSRLGLYTLIGLYRLTGGVWAMILGLSADSRCIKVNSDITAQAWAEGLSCVKDT